MPSLGGGVLCSHTYYPSCREAMAIFVVVGNPQPNYAFSFDKHIGCDKIDKYIKSLVLISYLVFLFSFFFDLRFWLVIYH